MRPKLLDLFCGAGGCSVGYARAGFDVVGVDLEFHRDYPYAMYVGDALATLAALDHDGLLATYDAVHASPPCPRYSVATPAANRDKHPDLVEPVRAALRATGLPYVIENVPGAPLENPVRLCGSMFGLEVRRHRLFETNVPMMQPECRHDQQPVIYGVYGDHGDGGRQYLRPGTGTQRGLKARDAAHAREVMGIDHMTKWCDLADAVPPSYCEWIGRELVRHIKREQAA